MFDYFENELSLIHINRYIHDYKHTEIHFEYLNNNYQKHKKEILCKIRSISIQYKLNLIYNKIIKKLGINEYNGFYLNELIFYNEQLELIDTFIEYQKKLSSILNEDNFYDIYKLSVLVNKQFCLNDRYLSNKINFEWTEFNKENSDICRSLIYDRKDQLSDTRYLFDEFFNYKYNQLTSSNVYKKML